MYLKYKKKCVFFASKFPHFMKTFIHRTAAIALLLIAVNYSNAQQQPIKSKFDAFGKINFTELAKKELLNPPKLVAPHDNEMKELNQKGIPRYRSVPDNAKVTQINTPFITNISEIIQPDLKSPAPRKSFTGLIDNNQVIPPDVNGAAGPNHLFETLNSQYRIFDKNGNTVSTLSIASFWSGLPSMLFYSDPHIVFDATSNRWITCIIAQQASNNHYAILIGVSLTTDPGGAWNEFLIDTGPSTTLPDYPLLGYNSKWVVITTNDFGLFSFKHVRIVVLDKAGLFAGSLGTVNTFFDATNLFTISPAETLDAGQGTEYMLVDYNGNSGGNGYVQVCTITGNTSTPVFTNGAIIGVNKPWSESTLLAKQKGTTSTIETGGTKMRAIMVRNGSIWATHTVALPANAPTHTASDFWQINPATNAVVQYGRIEDPTGKYFTTYPSLSVTATNDVLLASTAVGTPIYASCIYSYRKSTDAANVFRSPVLFKAGEATYFKDYGSGRNRWGDYSATCIDPVDGSFWTLQEFADSPANEWGTWWANVVPAVPSTFISSAITNSPVTVNTEKRALNLIPNPAKEMVSVKWESVSAGSGELSVFDAGGNIFYKQKIQVAAGANEKIIQLKNVNNGSYTVTLTTGNDIRQAHLIIEK